MRDARALPFASPQRRHPAWPQARTEAGAAGSTPTKVTASSLRALCLPDPSPLPLPLWVGTERSPHLSQTGAVPSPVLRRSLGPFLQGSREKDMQVSSGMENAFSTAKRDANNPKSDTNVDLGAVWDLGPGLSVSRAREVSSNL